VDSADSVRRAPDIDRLCEVCHDLRQPVASIIMLTEAALAQVSPGQAEAAPPVRDCLEEVKSQAAWLGTLIQQVLEPPHPARPEQESCDLAELTSAAIQVERATYPGELATRQGDSDVCVSGNRIEIRRAVANLLSNATRAAGPTGKVIINWLRIDDQVLLTVDDSGPGFGRIKPGIRLGLRIIARSVRSYGGQVVYRRSHLGGVRAVLVLRAVTE
jgi:signal transduction histidine kinase